MREKMRNKKHPYTAYLLLMIILGLTFWFSSQQGMSSHNMSVVICEKIVTFLDRNANLGLKEKQYINFVKFLDIPIRKTAHMAEYAVIGAILYVMVSSYYQGIWKRIICVVCLLVLAGCADEVHQLYVVAREGKWQDVVVDVIGGSIGILTVLWRPCRRR